jgi:hypothetical protein
MLWPAFRGQAEVDGGGRIRAAQRHLAMQFGGPGGIHGIGSDPGVISRPFIGEVHESQKAIGGERTEKQVLPALAVVDDLAPGGPMHLARTGVQIVNRQARPVLAVTVRENAVSGFASVEPDDRPADRLHAADGLHSHRTCRVVLQFHLQRSVGVLVIKLEGVKRSPACRPSRCR